MATYSSILAWKILWTEEPGRLRSMDNKRVEQDSAVKQQQSIRHRANLTCSIILGISFCSRVQFKIRQPTVQKNKDIYKGNQDSSSFVDGSEPLNIRRVIRDLKESGIRIEDHAVRGLPSLRISGGAHKSHTLFVSYFIHLKRLRWTNEFLGPIQC